MRELQEEDQIPTSASGTINVEGATRLHSRASTRERVSRLDRMHRDHRESQPAADLLGQRILACTRKSGKHDQHGPIIGVAVLLLILGMAPRATSVRGAIDVVPGCGGSSSVSSCSADGAKKGLRAGFSGAERVQGGFQAET